MFMVLCDIYMITMSGNLRLMAAAAFITFLWMTFTLDGWMSLREIGEGRAIPGYPEGRKGVLPDIPAEIPGFRQ